MEDEALSSLNTPDAGGICLGFYELLWKRKNEKQEKASRFPNFCLNIPDTIVYNFSKPQFWYFTSNTKHERMIKKKKRQHMNSKSILERFLPARSKSGISAAYMFKDESPGGRQRYRDGGCPLSVKYFDDEALQSSLLRLGQVSDNGVLQKFIDPKPAVDGVIRNSMIQTSWQPNHLHFERRQNKHALNDKRQSFQRRAETFEGTYQNVESHSMVSGIILDEIKASNDRIAEHFWFVADCIVKRMVLNWKIDEHNKVWFLFCSSIFVMDRDTVYRHPLDLLLKNFGKKKEREREERPSPRREVIRQANVKSMLTQPRPASALGRPGNRLRQDSPTGSPTKQGRTPPQISPLNLDKATRRPNTAFRSRAVESVYASRATTADLIRRRASSAQPGGASEGAPVGRGVVQVEPVEVFTDLSFGGSHEALKRILFNNRTDLSASQK